MSSVFDANVSTPSRPLPPELLTDQQRGTLGRLHDILSIMAREGDRVAGERSRSDDGPGLVEIEPDYAKRIVWIDGKRGTGKTSVLLTALAYWRKTGPYGPGANAQNPGFDSDDEVGRRIYPLRILDFDPIPEGIPLHAWLLQPFRDLALEAEPERVSDTEVLDVWTDLQDLAVTGYGGDPRSKAGSLDHDGTRVQAWFNLRRVWARFVDALWPTIPRTPSGEPPSLIVVPVDDVDLQAERMTQLIQACALFRHPRVVFLLAGDVDHAEAVVVREFRDRLGANGTDGDPRAGRIPRTLARAFLDKECPQVQRFRLSLFGIADREQPLVKTFLELWEAAIDHLLRPSPDRSGGRRPDDPDTPLSRIRTVFEHFRGDLFVSIRTLVRAIEVLRGARPITRVHLSEILVLLNEGRAEVVRMPDDHLRVGPPVAMLRFVFGDMASFEGCGSPPERFPAPEIFVRQIIAYKVQPDTSKLDDVHDVFLRLAAEAVRLLDGNTVLSREDPLAFVASRPWGSGGPTIPWPIRDRVTDPIRALQLGLRWRNHLHEVQSTRDLLDTWLQIFWDVRGTRTLVDAAGELAGSTVSPLLARAAVVAAPEFLLPRDVQEAWLEACLRAVRARAIEDCDGRQSGVHWRTVLSQAARAWTNAYDSHVVPFLSAEHLDEARLLSPLAYNLARYPAEYLPTWEAVVGWMEDPFFYVPRFLGYEPIKRKPQVESSPLLLPYEASSVPRKSQYSLIEHFFCRAGNGMTAIPTWTTEALARWWIEDVLRPTEDASKLDSHPCVSRHLDLSAGLRDFTQPGSAASFVRALWSWLHEHSPTTRGVSGDVIDVSETGVAIRVNRQVAERLRVHSRKRRKNHTAADGWTIGRASHPSPANMAKAGLLGAAVTMAVRQGQGDVTVPHDEWKKVGYLKISGKEFPVPPFHDWLAYEVFRVAWKHTCEDVESAPISQLPQKAKHRFLAHRWIATVRSVVVDDHALPADIVHGRRDPVHDSEWRSTVVWLREVQDPAWGGDQDFPALSLDALRSWAKRTLDILVAIGLVDPNVP